MTTTTSTSRVTVIPYSCKIGWFDWTEKKQVYVAAGSREQILLNVTPSEVGDFEFKVKAVSIMDPGTSGEFTASIHVEEGPNRPPVCACLMPDKSEPQQYVEGMNITWNDSAFDPEGDPLKYRFLLRGPNYKGFEVTQDWRNASYPDVCPTWTWTPSKRDQGLNDIRVEIGDGCPPGNCDVSRIYYDYWVGPSC